MKIFSHNEAMTRVRVASLSKFPPGSLMQVEAGGESYAVCNVSGEIHAVDGICPHSGGRLGDGALHEYTIVCPWHAWEYDCRTGACDFTDVIKLRTFPVTVSGDDICIDV